MFYYVYVLRSIKNKENYIGYTDNLNRRIIEHKKGQVFSTKKLRPLELIYFEGHKTRKSAINRETYLKTGWGRNYIKTIIKDL